MRPPDSVPVITLCLFGAITFSACVTAYGAFEHKQIKLEHKKGLHCEANVTLSPTSDTRVLTTIGSAAVIVRLVTRHVPAGQQAALRC